MEFGIDLGTTHSLIAVYRDGQAQLIPNVHGEVLTPSVVGIDDDGQVLVGAPARERLISHPKATVHAFKRMMGSEQLWSFKRHRFRSEELSALILKSLKADAEKELGVAVSSAVISVPAYFNDTQRNATRQAAAMAGLEVTRLVNEPTAAALVYGLKDRNEDHRYLVLDLGGGTFDVTILEYFDQILEVHASAGDNQLGGEDFTQLIVKWMRQQCTEQKLAWPGDGIAYQRAETAKRALAGSDHANIPLDDGSLELSTDQFDELASPLLARLRDPIIKAIRDASLKPEDFEEIVFIGGATRMPLFHQFVTRMFKRFPRQTENPDEVVALGAAIQAGMLARSEGLEEVVMTDVMPYSMGVGVHNPAEPSRLYFNPIIERNQTVPISRVDRFYPVEEKQPVVRMQIYQGESRYAENNLLLGSTEIPLPPDEQQRYVDVRFTYDVNGILEVLVDSGHGESRRLVIQAQEGRLTDAQVEDALKRLESLKIHPRDLDANRTLLARAERLYEQSVGETRDAVGRWIDEFNQALTTQDLKVIEPAAERFSGALDALEQGDWF